MNESNDMIKYRERRIKSGKNARLYGSILYISIMIFLLIVEDVEIMPLLAYLIIVYLLMISMINIRLFNEKSKLSRLLDKEKDADVGEYYKK